MLNFFNSIVRAFMASAAGGLVTNGFMTEVEAQQIAGAIVLILTIVWSFVEKKYFTKK